LIDWLAVTIYVGQQQLRAIPYHASSAGGADATRSARDERMDTLQPVSHLTSASYRRRIRRKGVRNQASMGAELLANVADESNRRHRCASIKPICSNRLMPAKQASFEAIAASPANNSNARHSASGLRPPISAVCQKRTSDRVYPAGRRRQYIAS
jgi:hypothetical protein